MLARRHDFAEGLQQREQLVLRNPEDLDVEIFRSRPSSRSRDEAADAQRAPAGVAHGRGEPLRLVFQIHMDSI